jgi:exportin-2 (importin alpha re-exporter)
LGQIEGQVLPPLQSILQQDIAEFMPYVFQIMTQLLYAHSEGIPAFYGSLVTALTQPVLWESSGNIPALAGLLQAYVQKGKSALLIRQGQLPAFLGVCQKLIASRANDHFGFELLFAIFENLSTQELSSYLSNLFLLLLNRLSSSKTEKFSRYFTLFLCGLFLLKKEGLLAENIIQILNSVQPK